MRFENDDMDDNIRKLEAELVALKQELARSLETEDHLSSKYAQLKERSVLIANRRAKRDSLVNAATAFEEDLAEAVRNIEWIDMKTSSTEDEAVADAREQIMEIIATTQYWYPHVGLERIFRK